MSPEPQGRPQSPLPSLIAELKGEAVVGVVTGRVAQLWLHGADRQRAGGQTAASQRGQTSEASWQQLPPGSPPFSWEPGAGDIGNWSCRGPALVPSTEGKPVAQGKGEGLP